MVRRRCAVFAVLAVCSVFPVIASAEVVLDWLVLRRGCLTRGRSLPRASGADWSLGCVSVGIRRYALLRSAAAEHYAHAPRRHPRRNTNPCCEHPPARSTWV